MTEIAPLIVSRVCGLPAAAVDALRAEGTVTGVRRALDAQERARRLAEPLGDALHALVPRPDLDGRTRRTVLRLRRDVHNLRTGPGTRTAAGLVTGLLDAEPARLLADWQDALTVGETALREAREASGPELEAAGRALLGALRTPSVARGLALASPDFTRELLKHPEDGAPSWDSRLARTATAYLTRTALKPSPFGTLTTVGVDGTGDSGARHAVSSSRAAALHLLHTWAAAPGAPDRIRLLPHPGVRDGRAALPLYCHAGGVFLREDEITDVSAARRLWSDLPAGPVSPEEAARLLGTGPEEIARLVAMGLLLPVTPWALPDGRHFTALAESAGPVRDLVADAVRVLADAEACLGPDTGSAERAAATVRARTALVDAYAALRRRPPDWLPSAGLLHEAVAHGPEDGAPLGPHARERLRELGAGLHGWVRRSALYDRMVAEFVRRYGAGGSHDLLGFCYDFLTADPFRSTTTGTREQVAPAPRTPHGHGTLAAPAQTVFFQTADDLLVVNRVHSGFSGMVARWAAIPSLHDRIDTAITEWTGALHPGCRVYQLSAHADWIEFQRPAVRGPQRVGWGPELAEHGRDAQDLRGFALAHDPATGTLQATAPDGHPAAFAYLGAVPPRSLHGVDRLLATLSDPWTLAGPAAAGDGSGCQPRLQRGGIVLRRATWEFPPDRVPVPDRRQPPVDFLVAAERWRREQELPEEVFLTQVSPGQHHKPQWVGFAHPHSVWSAFRRIDSTTTAVRLTEALPARRQHPTAPGADGGPRATEYIALLRQAAPLQDT
ncbi:hypothetical protein [Streptomyces sp. NPDC002825]|uniref:hypothetical protein n=1 Tax=Streptomyces sp. NPDC002825 TaxID=3154666 RepID=UPI003324CB9A